MVMRLENIQKQIDEGKFSEAYIALEDLLSLGPQNTGALKMKAQLFYEEGKFYDEAQMWKKVLSIDPDDPDAAEYSQRTIMEQREHEYFSDRLPSGGLRFLANPRSIVTSSFFGVMGCAVFLSITNFSHHYKELAKPELAYLFFILFVILPWIFILYVYFKALRDITIEKDAIHLRTRTKEVTLKWDEIANFYLARRHSPRGSSLFVLLISKNSETAPVLINIGGDSVVRAPSFLVREITRAFHAPLYEVLDNVQLSTKPKIFS